MTGRERKRRRLRLMFVLKELQEPGKGGMKAMYRDGDYNKVGDEVIGGEDKEVKAGEDRAC